MADEEKQNQGAMTPAQEVLAAKLGLQVGFDAPKFWCSQAQVHFTDHETLIVFREVVNATISKAEGGEEKRVSAQKNVVSAVMPKDVAIELARIILKMAGSADETK